MVDYIAETSISILLKTASWDSWWCLPCTLPRCQIAYQWYTPLAPYTLLLCEPLNPMTQQYHVIHPWKLCGGARLQFLLPASLEARISVPWDRFCERNKLIGVQSGSSSCAICGPRVLRVCSRPVLQIHRQHGTIEGLRCGIVDSVGADRN